MLHDEVVDLMAELVRRVVPGAVTFFAIERVGQAHLTDAEESVKILPPASLTWGSPNGPRPRSRSGALGS